MKRRELLHALLTGGMLLTPLGRALARQLLEHNGSLPAPQQVHAVLPAGPPAAIFVYCLAPEKMLGWPSRLASDSLAFIHPEQQALPVVGRLSGRSSTLSLEQLIQLAPQLIVDVGVANEVYRAAAREVTRKTGIATVQIEGLLLQTPQQLRQAGALMGVEERAEELAVYSEQLLARAVRFAQAQRGKPAKIYFARGRDGLQTGLAGSIHSEVAELLGCENVARVEGYQGLAQVSLEQLMVWQPDYVITQESGLLTQLGTQLRWQALRAVREGRLFCAPRLPFGWLDGPPGINRLLGLFWLMALLEERLGGRQLQEETAEFFNLFYRSPVPPSGLL